METIKLDLIPGKKMPSLHASQYDDGREHGIDLFENGVAYKLDGTETLTINERKGDDCICSLDIENTFADTNHIEFASTEQMCAVWGNNLCELVIVKGEVSIGTLNFILEVEPSPTENGIESESEINNLRRQVNEMVDEEMGDYLLKTEAEETYATITALETLSGVVDTKASKTYVDNVVSPKADKTYVDTELDKKADKSNTYTKTETDSLVSPKADKTYVDSVADTKADKATTYTKTEVDTLIDNLPEPMIFKGTLGVGGTIQTLPTASASNEGWTYKVITDGTYAGQTAKAGDVFTSSGSEWVLIPSADEDNDTWRAIKINGVEKLGNAISSGSADIVEGDNINITFDGNGNKVEIEADTIDDTQALTTKSWSSKKTFDEIVNILPTGNASGSIANFNTSLALPLVSVTSDDISASKVTRCGVNMWDEQYELGTFAFSNGTLVPANDRIRNKNKTRVLPNKKYYFVAPARTAIGYYDENDNYLGYDDQKQNSVITTKANTAYIYFFCLVTTYSNNISINCIETDTNYHAYNGVVKPIAEANEIVTLVGTNNIYADSGDIAVTYKKSIDDAIAGLQALILS